MLTEISHSQKINMIPSYNGPKGVRFIDAESQALVLGTEMQWERDCGLVGIEFHSCKMGKFWRLTA